MSFLLPVLRQSLRNGLPRNSSVGVPRIAWRIYPAVPSARYSQNRQPPSNTGDDPPQNPLSPDSSSTSNTKSSNGPLSGDVQAAPGSILSQYSPQESRDLDTTVAQSTLPKRDEYVSSADRKRDRMARIFSWGFFLGLVGGGVYIGRPLEEEERERVGWGDVNFIPRLSILSDSYRLATHLGHTGSAFRDGENSCSLYSPFGKKLTCNSSSTSPPLRNYFRLLSPSHTGGHILFFSILMTF